jgi:hypothetical protein
VVVSEAELQKAVIALAQRLQWRVAHFRPGLTKAGNWVTAVQGDGKGFPDLVCLRGDRLLVAELKSKTGRVAPEQQGWLDGFREFSGEAFVWRPHHWTNGDIELVLR